MRLKLESEEDQRARLGRWHIRFTWFPVCIDGSLVWLELVERKMEFRQDPHGDTDIGFWRTYYRAPVGSAKI